MPKKSAKYSHGSVQFEYALFAQLLVVLGLHCSPVLAQFQDYGHPLEEGQAAYIFLLNLEDGTETPLTEGRRPAWSPDGTRIAFYRPATHSSLGDMFLIDADGSGLSWLGAGIEPDWSPDGEHLVFVNDKGIAIREVGNSQSVTILEHRFKVGIPYNQGGIGGLYAEYDWGVGRPAWSPDGAVIAFEDLNAPDFWEPLVWLINADGSGLRLLTQTLGYPESGPAWSPDGSRIALFSWPRGLAIYDFAKDNREGLLEWDSALGGLHVGAKPTWSPNGDRLALHGISSFGPEVWLIQNDGTSPQVLITNAYEPDWAPNQPKIAFVSNMSGLTDDFPKGPVKEPDEPKDPPSKMPKSVLPKMPPCNADCGIKGKPVPLQNPLRQ